MANVKVSQLNEDTNPTPDDYSYLVDNATAASKKVTIQNLVEKGGASKFASKADTTYVDAQDANLQSQITSLQNADNNDVDSVNGRTGAVTLTKSDVGLANVDNTSDANKPVSTATQTALNGKENTITAGTTSQYYRGDKTFQTLNQDAVPDGTTNKAFTVTEKTKLAGISGTNTGDQTLSVAGQSLTISGANGNTVTLPSSTPVDATTTTKGVIQLAGDFDATSTAAVPVIKQATTTVAGKVLLGAAGGAATFESDAAKATDANVIHKTGDESASGIKTFTGKIVTTAADSGLMVGSGGGSTPKAINIGNGSVYDGQINGDHISRSAFSGKLWRLRNQADTADTFSVEYDTGITKAVIRDTGGEIYHAKAYGIKADAVQLLTGSMTANSAVLTVTGANFVAGDVGKVIYVDGAGQNDGRSQFSLQTTIQSITSATQVVLAASAVTTTSAATVTYGTNDTSAIQSLITTAGSNASIYFSGSSIINNRLTPLAGQRWYGQGVGKTFIYGSNQNDYSIWLNGATLAVDGFSISDMTLDVLNAYKASGMQWYTTNGNRAERVAFKNVKNGGWHVKIGVANGATDNTLLLNNKLIDCIFDGHEGNLESLLVFNAKNTEIIRPRFINNTDGGPTLGLWQKTYNTHIIDPTFINVKGAAIYYSITTESTFIVNPYFENTGPCIQGANISDNGAFGLTQSQVLRVINPVCIGGANSTTSSAIQIGAVNDVIVDNPYVENYKIGIQIDKGNQASTAAPTNWTINNPQIRNCNPTNDLHAIHPGIFLVGVGGAQYGSINLGEVYDDRSTKFQRYPIVFDGAYTWSQIDINGVRLSADTANGGTSIGLFDAAVLDTATVRITNNRDYSGTNPAQSPLNADNKRIINVATPTASTDGANKAYVDSIASGGTLMSSPTQTASFTGVAQRYYPVDATAGSVTMTLPTSTPGQQIALKKIDNSANIVFYSGTINGASATIPLRLQNQGKVLVADATGGWNVYAGDLDLTRLDQRYKPFAIAMAIALG